MLQCGILLTYRLEGRGEGEDAHAVPLLKELSSFLLSLAMPSQVVY